MTFSGDQLRDVPHERFSGCGTPPDKVMLHMAHSVAFAALRAHHEAELERLFPLGPEDLLPLPCSCSVYCNHSQHVGGLFPLSLQLACLWCAQSPLLASRHIQTQTNGVWWSDNKATCSCDVCKVTILAGRPRWECGSEDCRQRIDPGEWRRKWVGGQQVGPLCQEDSRRSCFHVCLACACAGATTCQEAGCPSLQHRLSCDSRLGPISARDRRCP